MKQEEKNIYVLMNSQGQISSDTLQLIKNNLVNNLAIENIGNALKYGFEELENSHAHVLSYGGVELFLIKNTATARNIKFNAKFINQEVHDMEGLSKINTFN